MVSLYCEVTLAFALCCEREQNFGSLSDLCGLDIWTTACGFQSPLLPSSPAPPQRWRHSVATSSFVWALFSGLVLQPCSPFLPSWWIKKGSHARRPSVLGGGGTRAELGWDSWTRTYQCSQSWLTETLAVKASNPCLLARLFPLACRN